MKVLGIRNSPTEIRFALSEKTGNNIVLLNINSENKLIFPKHLNSLSQKVGWLYQEFENIISNNPDIKKIAIKQNENVSTKYSTVQETAFYDAIAHLIGNNKGILVNSYVYNNIGTKSKEVKTFSESFVGKTTKNWNTAMADAIAATIKELK
ncbi:hypothetical protein [Flavobacterium anhuiense]|uniref:hypothetical protein n=1 Tax=Flavobacterium anhuiense TaxID=459526 RepID=UPI000E6C5B05|nr:hypothetical protein [Flavobacterium anhuiense]